MSIADRVKEKRMALGLTQSELASLVGITQQSLQKIEDGRTQNPRKLINLARSLQCDPEWLQFGKTIELKEPFSIYDVSHTYGPICYRPIISAHQAMTWQGRDSLQPSHSNWLEAPVHSLNDSFWLKVTGDSMTSASGMSIPEGYLILVDPGITAKNGHLILAQLNDMQEPTFKMLVIDAGCTYLKPLNTNYRPIEVDNNFSIIGVVREARALFHSEQAVETA